MSQKEYQKLFRQLFKDATLDYQSKGSNKMKPKPEIKYDELDFYNRVHEFDILYTQNWPAYNQAQTTEFSMFQDILIEILDNLIETHQQHRRGRPSNDFKEMIFCCVMRSYYGKSSRRSVSFLDYALVKGYISKKPHFNTVLNYYKDDSITPILKYLIEQSATPMKDVELDFTVDSSGFSTSLYGRWLDVRIQSRRKKRIFKKAHVTSGVKTNIITAIEATPGYYADSPQFPKLVRITSKNFDMREVSADKAYSSRKNLQTVAQLGAVPYIPFKSNATGRSRGHLIWGRMKKYYDRYQDHFMMYYHKRSNAESVFNMMKRKFGTHLYSKSKVGQTNEILCKALAHNICVLIQEYHENDLKRDYNKCAKHKVAR
jgi:transposase